MFIGLDCYFWCVFATLPYVGNEFRAGDFIGITNLCVAQTPMYILYFLPIYLYLQFLIIYLHCGLTSMHFVPFTHQLQQKVTF